MLPNGTGPVQSNDTLDPAAIYNQAGNLLWLVTQIACGDPALCSATFVSGVAGAPIPIDGFPALFGVNVPPIGSLNAIVTTGGLQDVLDVQFYDGSVDDFEVVIATPEPSCLIPLATVLLVSARVCGARISRVPRAEALRLAVASAFTQWAGSVRSFAQIQVGSKSLSIPEIRQDQRNSSIRCEITRNAGRQAINSSLMSAY